jgi:hypothetical protein
MKKNTIILFALFLICGTTILSFAQASQVTVAKTVKIKTEVIKGKIIAIDLAKNTIVLKEPKAGIEKTITIDSKIIRSLRENEEVKVLVKEGSDIATSVKEILKKTKSTKK